MRDLYLDLPTRKLFVATSRKGLFVYNTDNYENEPQNHRLDGISVNAIRPFKNNEILIATDGEGVFKIDTEDFSLKPYIIADYNEYNKMNGNAINDLFIDEDERIWMSVFPVGITVVSNRYRSYKLFKHSIGNNQSLINDQVNGVYEDSEGDIWFATGNGISLYETKTNSWQTFFDDNGSDKNIYNHIFLTLYEVEPGVIWAGGYNSDIYCINKKKQTTEILTFDQLYNDTIKPDKYIRCIFRDSEGDIWVGGFLNFKQVSKDGKNVKLYDIKSTTCIIEKNKNELWIGTRKGLYILNKKDESIQQVHLPMGSTLVYTLHQDRKGGLFIGTSNSGLLYYDLNNHIFKHYHMNNSSLISNNIYMLLAYENVNEDEESIVISTENGISRFYLKDEEFKNWTKDQGLFNSNFNALSGVYLKQSRSFIFGSNNGAIKFFLNKIGRAHV